MIRVGAHSVVNQWNPNNACSSYPNESINYHNKVSCLVFGSMNKGKKEVGWNWLTFQNTMTLFEAYNGLRIHHALELFRLKPYQQFVSNLIFSSISVTFGL